MSKSERLAIIIEKRVELTGSYNMLAATLPIPMAKMHHKLLNALEIPIRYLKQQQQQKNLQWGGLFIKASNIFPSLASKKKFNQIPHT